MNKESTPIKADCFDDDLGDSFFQLTPIRTVHSLKKNKSHSKNKVVHEREKDSTHTKTSARHDKNGKNILSNTHDEQITDKGEKDIVFPTHGRKRKKSEATDELVVPKSQKQLQFVKKNCSTIKDAQVNFNSDMFDSSLFDVSFDAFFEDINKISSGKAGDKESHSTKVDMLQKNQLPSSIIDEFLQSSSPGFNKSVPKNSQCLENLSSDRLFNDVELSSSKLLKEIRNKSNNKSDNSESKANAKANATAQQLNNSDFGSWSDESILSGKLSCQIKQKLLANIDNVDNINVSKPKSTGWSQMNLNFSLQVSSQFHELGPFYGLPSKVEKLMEDEMGIKDLYPWQKECLSLSAIKDHKNLIYALPTSGGKTLVAEILILRELLCYEKNVLFILPFVAIVQEKVRSLSQFAVALGFLVEEYAAGKGSLPPKKRRRKKSVLVATIEKGLALVHSLLEANRLSEFGLIVVDELHLISEGSGRGATLETLLTHVLYSQDKPQIIGMTATIGNLREVASYLKAETYSGSFRPVELSEYVKCGDTVYSLSWSSPDVFEEDRKVVSDLPTTDPDGIGQLVQEVIPNDSVLIFCPTKKNCENVALLLCQVMSPELTQHKKEQKLSFYRALGAESNNQVCPILKKTLPFGVAYHHSGLTADERKLLEEGFRDGTLCVICCTSTLAAGVNMPAKRVILRSPYIGKDFINLSKYKQMVGRAGRAGFGSKGESYLICQRVDCERVAKMIRSSMDESISKLDYENCKSLVLSSIGLGVATTRSDLRKLMEHTLLNIQAEKLKVDVKNMTDSCIAGLFKQGALRVKSEATETDSCMNSKLDLSLGKPEKNGKRVVKLSNDSVLAASRLGKAAMKGIMTLEQAHELYTDLTKAQTNLDLVTNLHLLYLITPYDMIGQVSVNNSVYFNVYMQLKPEEIHTAKTIGITEYTMSRLMTGIKPKNISANILNRFYLALILNELWKQRTIWEVASYFQVPRGQVQTLMSSAATFASNVLRFCEELEELWCFRALFNDFAPRLAHCCSSELLPLMDLPAVKRGRAKQLFNAGYKTLQSLAKGDVSDLVKNVDHLSKKAATEMIAAAKLLLLEKAENLKEEADEVLEGLRENALPKETEP